MIRRADFTPAWWLPGPHLQTLWPTLCRRKPRPRVRRERIELSDGDFLDLDWTLTETGPIVLILHGLEGSSDSGYARGLLYALLAQGWRGVVMHFRGCSGEPNRLTRSYNAGETNDLTYVINSLRRHEPNTFIACVGYSLGGNALLKWLGEKGDNSPIQAAVAVSVPFLLETAARRMKQGFSRLYQSYLLRQLKASYRRKYRIQELPVSLEELANLRDFYAFDGKITAPLHGYENVYAYYKRASCRQYLVKIRIPTLILHAMDDPFMLPEAVPEPEELSANTVLELSPHGGHVGFIAGALPGRPVYWLEQRILGFLSEQLYLATGQS